MKKKKLVTEMANSLTKEQRENMRLLEEYAKTKHEKEILIKALKIIINHQE